MHGDRTHDPHSPLRRSRQESTATRCARVACSHKHEARKRTREWKERLLLHQQNRSFLIRAHNAFTWMGSVLAQSLVRHPLWPWLCMAGPADWLSEQVAVAKMQLPSSLSSDCCFARYRDTASHASAGSMNLQSFYRIQNIVLLGKNTILFSRVNANVASQIACARERMAACLSRLNGRQAISDRSE